MGLSAWPVFASNRDPALTEYLGSKPASNTAAYVTIHSGGLTVSVFWAPNTDLAAAPCGLVGCNKVGS